MQKTLFSALALAAALTAAPALATSYSSLWVFGDSLSDNGNFYGFTNSLTPGGGYPPSPYWNGRFSNGPVAVEQMASTMGVPLMDFAFGGAKTGPNNGGDHNTFGSLGLLGTLAQANRAAALPGPLSSSALYVVWAGPNDFFTMGANDPATTIGTAVGNVSTAIMNLYGDGARHFFVPLMPDLGLTPSSLAGGAGVMGQATFLTDSYNGALHSTLAGMDTTMMPAGDIQFFDTAAFLRNTVSDPAGHGFSNVTDACVPSLTCIASNAFGYLFWDSVHPTTLAHQQLGLAFAAAVPEPESYAMFLAGLGVLGAVVARRRRAT
ncbi:MAG: SGNH/GDSL hydrolase family protein [Rhodocyclaceae bacterium]|nr:SGNH/GDSL hydrolase family protein [Rhodocyclaceae bacterium]